MAEPVTPANSSSNASISTNVLIFVRLVITVLLLLASGIAVILARAFAETEAFIMKLAHIYQQNQFAGLLEARDDGTYRFTYDVAFHGEPVSLTMPIDALLRLRKLDQNDLFGQLLAVGRDVVGSLRIELAP